MGTKFTGSETGEVCPESGDEEVPPPPPPPPPPLPKAQVKTESGVPSTSEAKQEHDFVARAGSASTSEAEQGPYFVAQVGVAYNAAEVEPGYLAVKENEDVLLYSTIAEKGHSLNNHSWYLYAKSCGDNKSCGWLPAKSIAGYSAFVARTYDADPDSGYLAVKEGERVVLCTDVEGHLIKNLEKSNFYAKSKDKYGWLPGDVIAGWQWD